MPYLEPSARLALRARLAAGLSQAAFAEAYRLDLATIRGWEQGRREPDRAARVLLKMIEAHPIGLAKLIGTLPID